MTRQELEHAIRAACDVANDTEVYVFGSQAILGQFPNAPEPLRMSAEADVVPKNHPERVDIIDGALGELSMFHETHGFYVHGISIEAATLADGWEERCIEIKNANTRNMSGWCLEGHDLAAAKLAAFRQKDRNFVRLLLREKMIGTAPLLQTIQQLPINQELRTRMTTWVEQTSSELVHR